MIVFTYKALDQKGAIISGKIEADSKKQAVGMIGQKQLTLLELKEKREKQNNASEELAAPQKSVLVFTKQMLSLSRAGLQLVDALELMVNQTSNENLSIILRDICESIKSGKSFSDALKSFPNVFTELYINTIHVGEVTGNLDAVLENLIQKLEKEIQLKKELKKAFRYPVFVVGMLISAFIVFITYVIPRFEPIFKRSQMDLPLPTKMVISISTLFSTYGMLIIFFVILAVGTIIYIYRTERGRYLIHSYILKIPVYGNLLQKLAFQRFASTLALLNRHGIPLVKAMDTAIKVESNKVFISDIRFMKNNLEKGLKLSKAMSNRNLFSNLMVHMVSIGEVTGSLYEILENAAEYNSTEIREIIDGITSLIEPVVTIVLALMVLLLALSIFLPMWNMLGIL